MLSQDYGTIIIRGLCNSAKYLVNHFKREIKELKNKGFEIDEIENDFSEVIEIFKNCIREAYHNDLTAHDRYSEAERSFLPKPDINQISVSRVKYPSGRSSYIGKNGHSVSIAGPSKTADLEKSLVVGAISLTVYVTNHKS